MNGTMNGTANGTANGHASHPADEVYDVLIVGAGISGINSAYRVKSQLPNLSYAIIEARDAIGGTWDLFRYPGIRSDSDLFTFGFAWNPWNANNPIAEGPALRKYLHETVDNFGISPHIQFRHKVLSANWSSTENAWNMEIDNDGTPKTYKARFVVWGTGYYDYNEPLDAPIPGIENFQGKKIHPQFWPEDLDYTNKKVVIIGSGATAITLLPNVAEKAARATMLQRSPSYILAVPNANQKNLLSYIIPNAVNRKLQRMIWIILTRMFYVLSQTFPRLTRWVLRRRVSRQLPKHIPLDPHFSPSYNPWDQRMCICPDGDFFKSLHTGRADIKTDTIKQVTKKGIQLNSGDSLDADIIVTATGLKLQIAGGARITIDGKELHLPNKYLWNGVMAQDVPNASFVIGYANASWTLGADATAHFTCRMLKYMEENKLVAAIPRLEDESKLQRRKLLNLNSTYVEKAEKDLPKAADKAPWLPRDNYISDYWFSQYGRIDRCLEQVPGSSLKLQNKKVQ